MTTTIHNHHTQRRKSLVMTTATIPSPAPRRAMLHALGPLDPEPAESPRRGLYVAFERISLGWWRWRCLHCGTTGSACADDSALAAAVAHPCAGEEVQA